MATGMRCVASAWQLPIGLADCRGASAGFNLPHTTNVCTCNRILGCQLSQCTFANEITTLGILPGTSCNSHVWMLNICYF